MKLEKTFKKNTEDRKDHEVNLPDKPLQEITPTEDKDKRPNDIIIINNILNKLRKKDRDPKRKRNNEEKINISIN